MCPHGVIQIFQRCGESFNNDDNLHLLGINIAIVRTEVKSRCDVLPSRKHLILAFDVTRTYIKKKQIFGNYQVSFIFNFL